MRGCSGDETARSSKRKRRETALTCSLSSAKRTPAPSRPVAGAKAIPSSSSVFSSARTSALSNSKLTRFASVWAAVDAYDTWAPAAAAIMRRSSDSSTDRESVQSWAAASSGASRRRVVRRATETARRPAADCRTRRRGLLLDVGQVRWSFPLGQWPVGRPGSRAVRSELAGSGRGHDASPTGTRAGWTIGAMAVVTRLTSGAVGGVPRSPRRTITVEGDQVPSTPMTPSTSSVQTCHECRLS